MSEKKEKWERIEFRKQISEPRIVKLVNEISEKFDENKSQAVYRLLQLGATAYISVHGIPKK